MSRLLVKRNFVFTSTLLVPTLLGTIALTLWSNLIDFQLVSILFFLFFNQKIEKMLDISISLYIKK